MATDPFIKKQLEEYTQDKHLGLLTLSGILPQLVSILDRSSSLGIIYIDLTRMSDMEHTHGWQVYDNFLKKFAEVLRKFGERYSHLCLEPIVFNRHSDQFLFFFPPTPNASLNDDSMENFEKLVRKWIERHMPVLAAFFDMQSLPFHYGYSIVVDEPLVRSERGLYRGVERSQQMALDQEQRETTRLMNQLMDLVKNEEIDTSYQPIFSLSDSKIIGYEALSSSRVDVEFHSTELLFSVANKLNMVTDLDRLCRLKAIDRSKGWLGDDEKLFLNTNPLAITDGPFDDGHFFRRLEENNLDPSKVVLEITERRAITHFDIFVKNINNLKREGIKIAIDDAGAGYASLNSIAELQPDYLKFDMVMVRDIDKNLIKQNLCQTILEMSNNINALMIAEGIETEAELGTVKKIGVHLGQGYFLSRPQKRS